MFQFNEERDEYVAERDGVEFVCGEPQDGCEAQVRKLSRLYWEKLPDLTGFMLPELRQVYGDLDASELPRRLGKPTIDLGTSQILYLDHTLDDTHIISLEYGGDLEEFYCLAIDG